MTYNKDVQNMGFFARIVDAAKELRDMRREHVETKRMMNESLSAARDLDKWIAKNKDGGWAK